MKAFQHQRGLSMIELLIALAISSFLILGITQIYIDNKRNHVFQQSQAGNLESSRFATLMVNEYLSKSGYRRNPASLLEFVFPSQNASGDCLAFSAGHSITGLDPDEGTGFCIRYQPLTKDELDCQGVTVATFDDESAFSSPPQSSQIVLAFKYEPGIDGKLQDGRLLCKSLNASTPQYVELLQGIADLRLDFGIGNADVLEKEVSGFISQEDWTPASGAIRSVRYAMLMSSRVGQRDGEDSKVLDDWLAAASDTDKERLEEADNKRIYQVASSTQTIRNLMP